MQLREAINAKCKECIYDPQRGNGTWRQQVKACTCNLCPLFAVRPLPIGEDHLADKIDSES